MDRFSKMGVVKLRNDMDSQLVSRTYKKLAEFCQKRNITDIVFNTCENINQGAHLTVKIACDSCVSTLCDQACLGAKTCVKFIDKVKI